MFFLKGDWTIVLLQMESERIGVLLKVQALAYEACNRIRMPLPISKTLEMGKKKYTLFDWKSFMVYDRSHSKNNDVFYVSLSIKHIDLVRKLCVFIFYFIDLVVKTVFLFSLHKGRQTSKKLNWNMNNGTIIFLTPLLIVLNWKILLLFSLWCKIISCFK